MSSQVRLIQYTCSQCGNKHNAWKQPCEKCGAYNTLTETRENYGGGSHITQGIPLGRQQGQPIYPQVHGPNGIANRGMVPATQSVRVINPGGTPTAPVAPAPFVMPAPSAAAMIPPPPPVALSTDSKEATDEVRFPIDWEPLDAITGGGMALGSSVLLSGAPGIGKSTLTLPWALRFVQKYDYHALIVTGEETRKQVLNRARRCQCTDPRLFVAKASSVDEIDAAIQAVNPFLLILDSAQAFSLSENDPRGEIETMKELTRIYNAWAKDNGRLLVMLCQVNKDGQAAGPLRLVHIVDAHFELFEIDKQHSCLASAKNRFGARLDRSWEMTSVGMVPWTEPAEGVVTDADAP
jgi:DNA repair protein RadA/Sms